jgi:hypothetical protein
MYTYGLITKILAAALMLAMNTLTADLRNEDGNRYEVRVHEGSTTRNTWIDGNSTSASICSDCEIEVVGVGRMKIKGSERLVIRNGRLARQ